MICELFCKKEKKIQSKETHTVSRAFNAFLAALMHFTYGFYSRMCPSCDVRTCARHSLFAIAFWNKSFFLHGRESATSNHGYSVLSFRR